MSCAEQALEPGARLVLGDALYHVEQVFDQYDMDRKASLNSEELRLALRQLLLPCTEKDVASLLSMRRGTSLSKADFVLFCMLKEFQLRQVFMALDTSGNGFISFDEFHRGILGLGWRMSDEEQRRCFARLIESDRRASAQDDQLSYLEWRHLILQAPPGTQQWEEIFHTQQLTSADILGDNLRPLRKHTTGHAIDLVAGFVAGCVSRTLTAPAERVKTELQLLTDSAPPCIRTTIRKVMAENGLRGFFQGNLANCIKVAPQSALFFALTDYFKAVLPTRGDPSRAQVHSFAAGTLAGLASQLIVYPLEPVKTVLTVAPPGRYAGILACMRQMVQEGGIAALYRGALPTLAGCIPYAGVQRVVYDGLQRLYTQYTWHERPSASATFACGLVSSSVAMTASYPLVLVRTRLQVQGTAPQHPVYAGAMDCFRKTVDREGFRGLMKGCVPNLLKSAPAAAVNFMFYEVTKDAISERWR